MILSPPAHAAEKKPVLRWGFSEYAPFKVKEGAAYSGIDVLLMRELSRKMAVDLELVDCPIARCLSMMKAGELDVLTALGLREDRQVYIEYISPPYNDNNPKVFYFRKDSPVHIESYEDLYKYRIGVKNGVRYFQEFDADEKIHKDAVDEVELNFRKLASGRIDAFVNTEIQADYLIVKEGFEGQFAKAPFRDESGRDFIGISRKSPFMARRVEISRLVRELVDGGRIQEIIQEFFNSVREAVENANAALKSKPVVQPAAKPVHR